MNARKKMANALLAIKNWDGDMSEIQFAKMVLKITITVVGLGFALMFFGWGKTGFIFLFVGGMSILPCSITWKNAEAERDNK
jgi:hypothetical protein